MDNDNHEEYTIHIHFVNLSIPFEVSFPCNLLEYTLISTHYISPVSIYIYMVHFNPRPYLRGENVLFLIFWFGCYFFSNKFFLLGLSFPLNLLVDGLPKHNKSVKIIFLMSVPTPRIWGIQTIFISKKWPYLGLGAKNH